MKGKLNSKLRLNVAIIFLIPLFGWSQSKPIPNPTSDINFEMKIPLKTIQKAINDNLPTLLVEDNSYTDNNGDDTKTWVYKSGNIVVKEYNEYQMQVVIPLRVKVDKRWGVMGVYQSQEFEFKMKMFCLVSGEINAKGELETKTFIQKYEYDKEPELDIAGVSIPITSVVQSELNENKVSYANDIDKNIKQNIPLKDILLQILQYFSSPYKASDDYNAWVDFECKKIQYTPFQIKNGNLQSQINLVSYLKIYMSEKPMTVAPIKYLPFIEPKYILPKKSTIHSYISIPFSEADKELKKFTVGETYRFQEDKYAIQIENAEVAGDSNSFTIDLETSGDFEGKISLSGVPFYDTESQEIFIEKPKFKARSKNVLYQMALWVKKGSIQKQIAQEYGVPIAENIQIIQESVDEYLNSTYYDALYLKGKTDTLEVKDVFLTDNGLIVLYDLNFRLSMELKEMMRF